MGIMRNNCFWNGSLRVTYRLKVNLILSPAVAVDNEQDEAVDNEQDDKAAAPKGAHISE